MWTLCGHCKLFGTGCTLGRAPRTKETLPDFCEWCRVTRHPLVFRRLTGCQRTPWKWGVTLLTLSLTFITRYICLTKNKIWVFHLRGDRICPILFHPNTRDLLLLLFYTTVSLDFRRCPIFELTTHSPRMVNNNTMHPHPTRRDVTVHMKCMMQMHFPSCYMYI